MISPFKRPEVNISKESVNKTVKGRSVTINSNITLNGKLFNFKVLGSTIIKTKT